MIPIDVLRDLIERMRILKSKTRYLREQTDSYWTQFVECIDEYKNAINEEKERTFNREMQNITETL